MLKTLPSVCALVLLGMVVGCAKTTVPAKTSDATPAETTLTPTPAPSVEATKPNIATAPALAPVAAPKAEIRSFTEAAFLDDQLVGVVVIHPKRITEWPVYDELKQVGLLKEFEEQMASFKIKPESLERITVVIDQTFMNQTARAAGLQVDSAEPTTPAEDDREVKNHLKQLGIGFYNYHDLNNGFPRADGNADGSKTGLSWRVHLLPLIEQADLYEQFHLDEPWDSDHNKTLIEKMPEVFKTPGVTEEGKTSVHVFVGEKTPFHGDKGTGIRDFTDGTSNTILAVVAGADTAEVWTKPGGLKFDPEAPKKALGNVSEKFMVLIADGSVTSLSRDIPDETLANLIQMNEGNAVEFDRGGQTPPTAVPPAILSLSANVDRAAIIESFSTNSQGQEEFDGQTLFKKDVSSICFFDETTVLFGSADDVKKMITTRKAGKPSESNVLKLLETSADFGFVFDLQSQSDLAGQLAQGNPIMGLLLQLQSVALQVNVTGRIGDKLVELVATTNEEQMAATLAQLAGGLLAQAKMNLAANPAATNEDKELQGLVLRIVQSASLRPVGDRVEFLVPVPEGFEKLPELIKPAIKKAAEAAATTKKMNNLKQIAVALHNLHDFSGKFPGAGSSPDGKVGLSWRVHALRMSDHMELYSQFNLDEPWDSETNKALIEKMPDLFKVDDVTEAGKTSLHVFTGPGAPFAKDQNPTIDSISDGLSNTILVVQAGPETAEIWTKPGGLDFDPENPIKSLGTLGETFLALMADGAVRRIPATVKPETLRRLIQSADGETIEDF